MLRRLERAHLFGRHDRLRIDGQSYRVVRKEKNSHFLQLVNDCILEDFYVVKTDRQINDLMRSGRLRRDEGWFSQILSRLRVRHDNSDLSALSEAELRTIAWKKEWCVRFLRQAGDPRCDWRPKRTQSDMRTFVENEKEAMDRWYLDEFGERRAPGRKRKGEIRKTFDYPSPSTLRDWLRLYAEAEYKAEAFRPGYDRCGNRDQVDPRALPIIEGSVRQYCSTLRPTIGDIYENVEIELERLNENVVGDPIYVSEKAVRRRINAIDPFVQDLSRYGPDYALRKYTPVGKGLSLVDPLERVEIDDWEVDLHSLISKSSVWKSLTEKQKGQVPRTRITATVAIDCVTRSIVGFHATPYTPSAATAKSALRSVMIDKTPLAALANSQSDWPMYGRVGFVATDGGPVFRGEFEESLRKCTVSRILPDHDPRMRGTIEAFFRTFKRLCRYFAGRAFKDVVEKGEYPAEAMASLTFDGFYKAAIIYIVDNYHHREHRGLEGGTPYGAWSRLTRVGLPPPLSEEQLLIAFGFKISRNVDKNGITFLRLKYNSEQLGTLYRFVGTEKLDVTIDPDDLGAILVRIPPKHRGRLLPDERHFLVVPCIDGSGQGVSLVTLLEETAAVRKLVKEEQEAGRPFRLAAHRYLLDEADQAMKTAGVPSHELTQKQIDLIDHVSIQKSRAALSNISYAVEAPPGDDLPGEIVAESRRTRPVRSTRNKENEGHTTGADAASSVSPSSPAHKSHRPPFGGSMNLYGDDE